jgi:hypothetical protein
VYIRSGSSSVSTSSLDVGSSSSVITRSDNPVVHHITVLPIVCTLHLSCSPPIGAVLQTLLVKWTFLYWWGCGCFAPENNNPLTAHRCARQNMEIDVLTDGNAIIVCLFPCLHASIIYSSERSPVTRWPAKGLPGTGRNVLVQAAPRGQLGASWYK